MSEQPMYQQKIRTDWNPEGARDDRLRRLHAYWCGKRAGRALPGRCDIDPSELGRLLPHVFLVDVSESPRDYRFRLAGTHMSEFIGMQMEGKGIAEVFPPDVGAEVRAHWDAAIDDAAPIHCQGRLWAEERAHLPWEGVVMPLAAREGGIGMLFGGFVVDTRLF